MIAANHIVCNFILSWTVTDILNSGVYACWSAPGAYLSQLGALQLDRFMRQYAHAADGHSNDGQLS